MSCYHPLKGFQIGYHPSGKPNYKICSYSVDHLERSPQSGQWVEVGTGEVLFKGKFVDRVFSSVDIPCGHCIGCRISRSRDWACRLMLELKDHDEAWFVTLTYDDRNLPINYYGDVTPEGVKVTPDGEVAEYHFIPSGKYDEDGNLIDRLVLNGEFSLSLQKRDLQLFFKRLRKACANPLRYYAVGEYGSRNMRPHYHAIIFGLHIPDLVQCGFSGDFPIYNSKWLKKIWSNGIVRIGHVTWESCAYTARYIQKKLNGASAVNYTNFQLCPEFSLMSRRPGIGRKFFDENSSSIYDTDSIYLSTMKGGIKIKPSRYYDKLFDVEQPDVYQKVKSVRKERSELIKAQKLAQTNLSYLDLLSVEERNFKEKVKSLKRSKV